MPCMVFRMMDLQTSSSLILLPFLLFIFFMVFRMLTKSKPRRLPPGPWKLPIIGSMHHLLSSLPHHGLRELANKYGPIMHLQLGELQNIVVSSPEIAKTMMTTHDVNISDRPHLLISNIIFYNCRDIANAPYGEYWRQMRKISILELLSAKRVQSFKSVREEEVSNFIRSITSSAGRPINLSRMLFALKIRIISRTAFGKICKDQEAFVAVAEGIIKEGTGFNIADLFPSSKLLYMISGMRSKLERLHKEADMILENIINEHNAKSKETANRHNEGVDDLVNVLLNLQQEDGNKQFHLTTDSIKGVILDMFIAGSETSSTVLEWVMTEMLKNPRIMEKAQTEVRQVFGKKGVVDEARLKELTYLHLVIKETVRLHPPLPLLSPRECREGFEVNGYWIPAKAKVIFNAWAMGRDPNYWIEPLTLKPEIFLDDAIDYKGNNFESIPFGAGRRICPGMSFGMISVELTLSNLLLHFDWKLPNGMKPESLDMDEAFGAAARRKTALTLVPTLCHPLIFA